MMSGLLLLFILIMAVCLLQAQKNYTEKLAEQAKYIKTQQELDESQAQIDEQQALLKQQESELNIQKTTVAEQEEELKSQEMSLAEQAKMLEELQATLEDQRVYLVQKESEVEQANTLVLTQEQEIEAAKIILAQREAELAASQDELDEATETLIQNQSKLDENKLRLDEALALMATQQEKIDQIIGVKAELIDDLNQEFKKADVNVKIDRETGAILLDSSVLFEFGESALTDEGSRILEQVLPVYCRVLLDGDHAEDVGEIIIDGYTDSVGEYMENLVLSQNRALSVARYLLTNANLSPQQIEQLHSKLSVNGKASGNPILTETGEEDMDASRRVEVKFRLKDEEMISELESLIAEGQSTASAIDTNEE